MNFYEICEDTLAVIPYEKNKSKIIEKTEEFIVDKSPIEIINDSCLYFGSSYSGRLSATKYLLGISYKSPIVIEETRNIIFFPTLSPRVKNCYWINLNNIKNYEKSNKQSRVIFNDGKKLEIPISFGSLDNQVLRATRLESIIRKKKK